MLLNLVLDLSEVFRLAGFRFEYWNSFLLDELKFTILIRSDSEVDEVSTKINAVEMVILRDLSGQVCQWHTVGIS